MVEEQSPFLHLVSKAREQNTFLSRTFSLENICLFQVIEGPSKVKLFHKCLTEMIEIDDR